MCNGRIPAQRFAVEEPIAARRRRGAPGRVGGIDCIVGERARDRGDVRIARPAA